MAVDTRAGHPRVCGADIDQHGPAAEIAGTTPACAGRTLHDLRLSGLWAGSAWWLQAYGVQAWRVVRRSSLAMFCRRGIMVWRPAARPSCRLVVAGDREYRFGQGRVQVREQRLMPVKAGLVAQEHVAELMADRLQWPQSAPPRGGEPRLAAFPGVRLDSPPVGGPIVVSRTPGEKGSSS
jgi:hypothetical protein